MNGGRSHPIEGSGKRYMVGENISPRRGLPVMCYSGGGNQPQAGHGRRCMSIRCS